LEAANLSDLPGFALDLLETSPVGRLGFLDADDTPRVLPVTYAIEGGALVTAVDHKPKRDPQAEPARVAYLRRRPDAALTVDRYSPDWSKLAWVQVIGAVAVTDAAAAAGAIAALRAKYEQYAAQPPRGPVLRLRPRRIVCWTASP
jgi:PPOX class probable F420-dependent enzyme